MSLFEFVSVIIAVILALSLDNCSSAFRPW
jgi:hypothetical protein